MFDLKTVGDAAGTVRLTSTDRLTGEDFRSIAQRLGRNSFAARKIGLVAARRARWWHRIETRWNGRESEDVAAPGDWIVTTLDANGKVVLDAEGHVNSYVVKSDRFARLYAPTRGKTRLGKVFSAKGVVEAVYLPGGFDIQAPWGEQQTAAAGYLLINGKDIYGNAKDVFDQTYQPIGIARDAHIFDHGPKRILSLDGGGVRGLITLGLLTKVEAILRGRILAKFGAHEADRFRLCDYFDLIGGTSTGALIATLLALGYRVDDIVTLYKKMAPSVFRNRRLLAGIQSKFDSEAFRKAVNATLGDFLRQRGQDPKAVDTLRMNSDEIRTGLAIVTKRIDTGAVWVLANNRKAKYWDPKSHLWEDHLTAQNSIDFYPNSEYPLATVVRASASAPYYLEGVDLEISPNELGHFLDGGASPCNNPCQELFVMTTLKDYTNAWTKEGVSPFGFKWETGGGNLFMLSLGTGTWRERISPKKFKGKPAAMKAMLALAGIIGDAEKSATVFMQAISEGPNRHRVDSNLLEMQHLRMMPEPLLTFRRVSPLLEDGDLKKLGEDFKQVKYKKKFLKKIREIDRASRRNLDRIWQIGLASGEKLISEQDFPESFDLARAPSDYGRSAGEANT
jgi:uncharacterized protein